MALIYRSESTKRRQKNKKPKPPPKKPKFPKLPQKGKGKEPAERPKISDPFDPILGTAHANNRLNGFFGVNPEDLLPRDESMPHLNQWISEALASIAYKCSKAHHLTKKICFPQAGWKRFKQRLGLTEDDVLTHVLRNIANMFKHLRDYYMDARAPPVVECLEESDLLWQNVSVPTLCCYLLLRLPFLNWLLTSCCRFLNLSRALSRSCQRYFSVATQI